MLICHLTNLNPKLAYRAKTQASKTPIIRDIFQIKYTKKSYNKPIKSVVLEENQFLFLAKTAQKILAHPLIYLPYNLVISLNITPYFHSPSPPKRFNKQPWVSPRWRRTSKPLYNAGLRLLLLLLSALLPSILIILFSAIR